VSPTDGPPRPDPKARTLARGPRKYRRKVASPKQWQAIIASKAGPCRCCGSVVHGGDDVPDNIVPLCLYCHDEITARSFLCAVQLLPALDDAEYAYMIQRGGEGYPERAYGIEYRR
jgi:hypothetical protein